MLQTNNLLIFLVFVFRLNYSCSSPTKIGQLSIIACNFEFFLKNREKSTKMNLKKPKTPKIDRKKCDMLSQQIFAKDLKILNFCGASASMQRKNLIFTRKPL